MMRYLRFAGACIWMCAFGAMVMLHRSNPWRNVAAIIVLAPLVAFAVVFIPWTIWHMTADGDE